jgi:hypothetical protein
MILCPVPLVMTPGFLFAGTGECFCGWGVNNRQAAVPGRNARDEETLAELDGRQ